MQEFSFERKTEKECLCCVYKGINNKTGEKVAVVVINKKFITPKLLNSLWTAIDSMEKCKCENFVRLIKKEDYPNEIHLIMELCDSDLEHHLKDNHNDTPFSEGEIRETFLQLNNGFQLMLKNNIIQRRLKLEDIMIKYTDKEKKHFIPKLCSNYLGKILGKFLKTKDKKDSCMIEELDDDDYFYDEIDYSWNLGCMIYELYYRDSFYNYGGKIKNLFNNDSNNERIPNDPNFKDLLIRLLEENKQNRISLNQYFNHPFFVGNNAKDRYEKISDFYLGINCINYDKDIFNCYIAKDNECNMKVLIKSYKLDFISKYQKLLDKEIDLFIGFSNNNNVLKYLKKYEENGRLNLVFEYREFLPFTDFVKDNKMTEKEIRKYNKILYENIFKYIEIYNIPSFSFISIYSFGIDKNDNPLIVDFGLHLCLIPYKVYSSYYLSNLSECSFASYKTCVLNYGVTLLKSICGDNFGIKNNEIIIPQNINLSNDFKNFISKCIYRNANKRYSWLSLGKDEFALDNGAKISKVIDDKVLLDNDKLDKIFNSLKNKFKFIIDYYQKLDIKNNIEYIEQIEIFITVILLEMKIVLNFFDRNIYEKPFTIQHEISFISINENGELKAISLNLKNPLLDDIKIIDMIDNKLILEFVSDLKQDIKKIEHLSKKIHNLSKNKIDYIDYKNFLMKLLDNINNNSMQKYFFSLIVKSFNINNKEDEYNELCLAEYLCEFLLFFKAFIIDKEEKYIFDKNSLLEKFCQFFGENKNIVLSAIKIKEVTNSDVLVFFISTLLKTYKNMIFRDKKELEINAQSLNGISRYYPDLMKKILD